MNLTIRGHHTSIYDELRALAEKKLARLERYLPRVGEVIIEVEHEDTRSAAHRYTVQITAHTGASILRSEERAGDPRAALELATEVLSQQARRHKKRLHDRQRAPVDKGMAEEPVPAGELEPEDEEEFDEYLLGKIVRVKHFEAKPMSQEEALAQMDLLGHDFFLFLDAATNDYALLYKRRDGGFGLLAPRRG